jgi:Domain of unknown function (DUF4145)
MKCPHCLVEYHDKVSTIYLGQDVDGDWGILKQECPSCKRLVLQLVEGNWLKGTSYSPYLQDVKSARLIRPKVASRSPVPQEVPIDFAQDYSEACNVLTDSPKASAALSRRCLQHILREKAGVKKGDLANEIQQVIDSKQLSSYLIDSLDAIRNIGNFAAHPMKSNSTGAIVDVEQGEADWNLDVIEALFDAYFVQPAVLIRKRENLNKKLNDVGKPPMK